MGFRHIPIAALQARYISPPIEGRYFLEGDPNPDLAKRGTYATPLVSGSFSHFRGSISDESLQKKAWFGSVFFKGPYFLIARPGTFGSSGHHLKDRRTLLEIRIAMAALDALKRHYGFNRFHLVGQSGGGHTVAGLVQLRSDIGCAVIASSPISLRSMMRDRGHPIVGKHRFYDPIDHVNTMRQRPGLRLFVVSDRKDKLVSYRSQLEFVERVKAHNLPITHVTATATDKYGLFAYGHQRRQLRP